MNKRIVRINENRLNIDSNPVKGRPYILNPRITIVGPLGVLKIIR